MKKEKTIRTYQRRTKTGKVVTVKQHTAKYDAAETLKEAAKKKGAGDELEKLKGASKVKDLINDPKSPWFEFENNFEEGWGGDSSVFCLANNAHHREVANLAANELAKKYNGESFFQKKGWESIAQKAYNDAAKKLYPKEKLWSGDNEDNPAFWHEHLTAGGYKKSAIKQFWRKEWGSFEDFGKKGRTTSKEPTSAKEKKAALDSPSIKAGTSKVKDTKVSKDAPKGDSSYGFTADEYKAWYHWDQEADPKNKVALKVEKARAKRDKEAAKKYRESLKSEGFKSKSSDVDKAPKSSKSKTQIWGKSESAAIKMFDKYVAKNGYPGDGKPSMKILGQYLRQTLKKNKYGTDKEIEKKVKEYLG